MASVTTRAGRRATRKSRRQESKRKRSPAKRPRDKDGCVLTAQVIERQGGLIDQAEARARSDGGRRAAPSDRTAHVLAAVGHPARLRILWLLLKGPAVYRALENETGLRAGPLYHHVNQLRLMGLIRPKQRDLYELSRGGRNVVLLAAAVGRLSQDRRARPAAIA